MVKLPTGIEGLLLTQTEPAQKQASESFLTRELIDLISSPGFNDSRAFLGYACKLLDLMVAQGMNDWRLSSMEYS